MNYISSMRIAIALCIIISMASCADSEKKFDIPFDLNALAGRWEMVNGNEKTIEEWSVNDRGANGIGVVLLHETDTVFIEYMSLELVDSTWHYVVRNKPAADSPSVPFRMTSCNEHEMVFENPDHDNPNLICYRLENPNRLHAWIEGFSNGEKSRTDFEYVRK